MVRVELTERDILVLEIERQRWRYPAHKEQAIRERLDLSATRYYQVLNSLLDHPQALEKYPMMLHRLREALPQ
jgi:hypothetical protein